MWFYFISPKDFVNNLLLLLLDKEPVSIKKYIKKWYDVFCSRCRERLAGLIFCRFWHWVLFENFIGCVFMKGMGEGVGGGVGPILGDPGAISQGSGAESRATNAFENGQGAPSFLKTFVAPFRRPRLTAPGCPRMGGVMLLEFNLSLLGKWCYWNVKLLCDNNKG